MTAKGWKRGLVTAGALLLGLAVATSSWAQGMYYKEIMKDGRIYVFNDAKNGGGLREERRDRASASRGSAPARTARPSSPTTRRRSSCSSSSTASRRSWSGPSRPTQRIEWRDGKTRITLGNNFYMEMSNRIQPRFTYEMPDDSVTLPGTGGAGDSKGSFRIRRAKFKLEGWFYKPELEYEFQLNWPDVTGTPGQPVPRGRQHRLGPLEEEGLPHQVRPVQGALRPPAAHLLGRPAVRGPRRSRTRATTTAARPASRSGARSAPTSSTGASWSPTATAAARTLNDNDQVPLHGPRDVAGHRQHAHEPVGLGRRS